MDITKFISNKFVLILLFSLGFIILFSYYYNCNREMFEVNINPSEQCKIYKKHQGIIIKKLEQLENKVVNINENSKNILKDQVNDGISLIEMQTRDFILGDSGESWCQKLNPDQQKAILDAISKEVETEVKLYDAPELFDYYEKLMNDDGIQYNGNDEFNDKYLNVVGMDDEE